MHSIRRAFGNILNSSIYQLVEVENLLLSLIFCRTVNLKKSYFISNVVCNPLHVCLKHFLLP